MGYSPGRGVIFVLALLLVGAGLFAGVAYSMRATDDPAFCGGCHVMNEAVRTQQMSIHANLSCNECHAPKATVPKIIFKTRAGAKDIYMNTLGDVSDVIHATKSTRQVVNENCINCHAMTILNVADTVVEAKQYCTDCHRSVPHMSNLPIAQRRVADE